MLLSLALEKVTKENAIALSYLSDAQPQSIFARKNMIDGRFKAIVFILFRKIVLYRRFL